MITARRTGAVDPEKQRYTERAGREYARRANVDFGLVRFDSVSVLLTHPPKIELLKCSRCSRMPSARNGRYNSDSPAYGPGAFS